MGFRSGSVSYARYQVIGDAPGRPDQALLDQLAELVLKPGSIGVPPETQAGWCAGEHVFDDQFEAEKVAFGSTLLVAMRLDSNKVPAELRRAYRRQAEHAAADASPTGVINRAERQAAREEADHRCRQELAEGRHRRSRMIPVLWDLERHLVLAPTFSDTAFSALNDLFRTSFDVSLRPLSAGAIAQEYLSSRGEMRNYEDLTPTPFTAPPPHVRDDDGDDDLPATPRVPWAHAGPDAKDFLGNEFIVWLWRQLDEHGGLVRLDPARSDSAVGVVIDAVLDMDCAWDTTGKQTLRADGPTQLPEARAALKLGKWPRKAGLVLATDNHVYESTLQADRMMISSTRLPRPEDAAGPREMIEQRLDHLRTFDEALIRLFQHFIERRVSSSWPGERDDLRAWVARSGRREMAPRTTPSIVAG